MTKKFLGKDLELATILPFDRTVSKMVRSQRSMQTEHGRSMFATRIENLARNISGVDRKRPEGFFARLLDKTGTIGRAK